MDKNIDVDKIWMILKPLGIHQIALFLYLTMSDFQLAVMVLNYLLIGKLTFYIIIVLAFVLFHFISVNIFFCIHVFRRGEIYLKIADG